jgi:hypothetical protein
MALLCVKKRQIMILLCANFFSCLLSWNTDKWLYMCPMKSTLQSTRHTVARAKSHFLIVDGRCQMMDRLNLRVGPFKQTTGFDRPITQK